MQTNNTKIEINNISKSFGEVKSLDNVTATIKQGSIFGLVGSNGAGKSTLLRIMSGIYRQDYGDVLYDVKSRNQAGYHIRIG